MAKVKWQLGTVRWFDDVKGDGILVNEKGERYYIHYSSIEGKENWKSLKSGQQVEFTVFETPFLNQVDRLKEV